MLSATMATVLLQYRTWRNGGYFKSLSPRPASPIIVKPTGTGPTLCDSSVCHFDEGTHRSISPRVPELAQSTASRFVFPMLVNMRHQGGKSLHLGKFLNLAMANVVQR